MQPQIPPMLRSGLRAITQKRVPEVLAASLSIVVAFVFASHLATPAPSVAPVEPRVATAEPVPAANDAGDPTADFLERVALSHVAALKTPAPDQPAATSGVAPDAAVPLPPRRFAAGQARAAKERIAATTLKDASSPQPPQAANAPAATPAATDRPGPLQYGMRLFTSVGDFVSASDKRVIDGVASVGDALTSFVKKLKT
jgi:hypothetical protein